MLAIYSEVEFQRTVYKFRKRKRKSLSGVPVLHETEDSRRSRAVTAKKCTSSGGNLLKYKLDLPSVIMSLTLMTTLFCKAVTLQGEIWCSSLLECKGLLRPCSHYTQQFLNENKIIVDMASVHAKNTGISGPFLKLAERSNAEPISKVDRHISNRFRLLFVAVWTGIRKVTQANEYIIEL